MRVRRHSVLGAEDPAADTPPQGPPSRAKHGKQIAVFLSSSLLTLIKNITILMPLRTERNHDWFAARVCGNRLPLELWGRETRLRPDCPHPRTKGTQGWWGGGLPSGGVGGVGVHLGLVEVGNEPGG